MSLLGGSLSAAGASPRRPNIVIILADDLGYGDLSCYGAKDMRTPQIDSLADRGMRFDTFYANSTVCSPSRAALLSGRYPELVGVPGVIRTRVDDNWGYLAPGTILLPAVLKQAGYHTALIGKWHLGLASPNTPNEKGFDLFHGFLGDMMDSYTTHRREGFNYMRLNAETIDPAGHATDIFTAWAIDYLHERAAAAREGTQPFFLYLAYNAPHIPIQPPQEWLDRVKRREPGIDEKRAKIVALIEHMDDGVGKVIAALKESGVEDNTLVIFASDNGGELAFGAHNGDLRGGKGSMYEGGLRVPMCAVWLGHIAPHSQNHHAALHMDLMPTACEAAGAAPPPNLDGISLLPTFADPSQATPLDTRPIFFLRREGGRAYNGLTIHAVRQGDWKLIHNLPFKGMELYNLKTDPHETEDQSTGEKKLRDNLAYLIQCQIQRGGAVPWQKPEMALPATEPSPK
ncbi:MAG TPA: sulfatase-like hydrolase/transferase [Tepidisphaeraceae bacterium]|nr:sulfatase-like hydrolase/transferase [Tepidisphaeraceae bacterium]